MAAKVLLVARSRLLGCARSKKILDEPIVGCLAGELFIGVVDEGIVLVGFTGGHLGKTVGSPVVFLDLLGIDVIPSEGTVDVRSAVRAEGGCARG